MNILTTEAIIIIQRATKEFNSHGGHIDVLTHAINTGNLSGDTLVEIVAQKALWVKERNDTTA